MHCVRLNNNADDGVIMTCDWCYCVRVRDKSLDGVVTDVIIQTEKDIPPPGYTLIERTLDSSQ